MAKKQSEKDAIEKKKVGRPKWEFDEKKAKEFTSLCTADASIEEVSAYFGVDAKTLKRAITEYYQDLKETKSNFSAIFREKKQLFTLQIKLSTLELLKQGNPSIAIFLNKTVLGRVELQKIETNAILEIDYSQSGRPDFKEE